MLTTEQIKKIIVDQIILENSYIDEHNQIYEILKINQLIKKPYQKTN